MSLKYVLIGAGKRGQAYSEAAFKEHGCEIVAVADPNENVRNYIRDTYNVPHDMCFESYEDLLSLPGVGRKTANLLLGDVFGKPAIVVDTHAKRISNRLGLSSHTDPEKIEQIVNSLIEPEFWTNFSHLLIQHKAGILYAGGGCGARYQPSVMTQPLTGA